MAVGRAVVALHEWTLNTLHAVAKWSCIDPRRTKSTRWLRKRPAADHDFGKYTSLNDWKLDSVIYLRPIRVGELALFYGIW